MTIPWQAMAVIILIIFFLVVRSMVSFYYGIVEGEYITKTQMPSPYVCQILIPVYRKLFTVRKRVKTVSRRVHVKRSPLNSSTGLRLIINRHSKDGDSDVTKMSTCLTESYWNKLRRLKNMTCVETSHFLLRLSIQLCQSFDEIWVHQDNFLRRKFT